ncbi:MAG: prolyl oligopeptidase family serine peptidase [Planctomycetes bacterium]|nr:prolyl oligopeptidase family serine peptidase [Planctomycetota bacterium]
MRIMPAMRKVKQFTLDVGDRKVRGTFSRPETNGDDDRCAAILMCDGLATPSPFTDELFEHLADALHRAGIATLTFGPCGQESNGQATERLAVESIDAASAVFRWLALQEKIDLRRIGVLGFSLGSIVAACLTKRTDQIARLCLLAPTTPDDVLAHISSNGDGESAPLLGVEQANEHYFADLKNLTPPQDAALHDRPTLILHGAADRAVPAEISYEYSRAIELADHHVQHTLIALADHFFTQQPGRGVCLNHITRFFESMGQNSALAKTS